MGHDEIAKLCANMTLMEKEWPVLRLQDDLKMAGMQRLALSRVSKVLTNKLVNINVFIGLLKKIWQCEEDRCRVMAGGPWTFDGALIVLVEPSGKGNIANMSFQSSEFWVQIHGVPMLCMTKEIGQFLGRMVGLVKEVDVRLSGECSGDFLRIRVAVDVKKPFRRCLRVDVL
ncbi:hypothetical protein Dsin_030058 [Dipteronia sinensis]|uniref:DUF4283 domain-containing protein n=1 Tax=Dipteronia sinensis TaxID=43782 RepID=A0AAD9ZI99_9ROSI|nr:hypothetical protein Dsin_030058 [Dipteronia sinensis]